jgi:NAD(P)-dependent dehydrogenase (short-subunit alcohol dehydrogenase family)
VSVAQLLASDLLAPDLLRERSILVVTAPSDATGSPPGESFGRAVAEGAEKMGARVSVATPDVVLAEPGGLDMLVVDGAALFARGGLGTCLEGVWEATAAVVNGAFLPAALGGRIVYLAPAPGTGKQADAARAGLENLARTLSVEWARHRITVVTIALGDATIPSEAAALTAYLASPAGAYFSGCQLDLRGV